MSTSGLLVLDLVLAAAMAAAWVGAAVLALRVTTSRQRSFVLAAVLVAALLLAGQIVACWLLSMRGWPFAQEKILFAIPLELATALLAILASALALVPRSAEAPPPARQLDPRSPSVSASFILASAAGVAGIIARTVVGFPMTVLPAVVLTLCAALAGGLAYSILASRQRRERVGAAALITLVAVSSLGYAWLADVAQPGALIVHEHTDTVAEGSASTDRLVSVDTLRTPADAPGTVRAFDLTARHQLVTSASGETVDAWSFGSLPGPEIRVNVGEIVDVTLRNEDIAEGVTIHWHGYDVPNGEDGVAGATQDAVLPGESFEYRFVADQPGTYWYHTHQASAEGIRRGLYGSLIVLPAGGVAEDVDLVLPLHTFGSAVWLGDADDARIEVVDVGETVRVRMINTDQLPRRLRLSGAEFLVIAADGHDIVDPTPLKAEAIRIPAGGRIDLAFTVPPGGVLLSSDASTEARLGFGPADAEPLKLAVDRAAGDVDLLAYGRRSVEVPAVMRDETMVLDQLPRFLDGVPTNAFTVNGSVFPHIESIEVSEGDVIRLTVINRSRDTHPMHIHGHHVLVLGRNGVAATGSALWLDTFDVQPGEVWQVMLVADNPGIWMDHCHNLDHAAQGMMMALTYRNVVSPYDSSHITG